MSRISPVSTWRGIVVLGAGLAMIRLAAVASAADASASPDSADQPRVSSSLSEVNLQGFDQLQSLRWGRDPFAQPTPQEAMAGTLVLTSILYSPASAVAVINGQVVHAGEDVDGRRVVSIGPDHVIVREGALTRRLQVPRFTAANGAP